MKNTPSLAVRGFTRLLTMFMALLIAASPMSTSYAQAVDPVARGLAAKANTAAGISAAGGVVAARPLLASIGDSQIEYETSGGYSQGKGAINQARSFLKGRFDYPLANNFGVSGKTSTQVRTEQLPLALASSASWIVVLAGTNDPGAAITKETTKTNLFSIYDALIAAGKTVVAFAIPPRSVWTPLSGSDITAARYQYYWVNKKIREYGLTAKRGTFYVVDADTANLDYTQTSGNPLAGTTTDGIHQSDLGGELRGQAMADVLDPVMPKVTLVERSLANVYDATLNPTGNRLSSLGYMTGTGGTVGTGCSGTASTGWTIQRNVGSTITCVASKRTRPAVNGVTQGGEFQDIALGGCTAGATSEEIVMTRDLSGAATAGERLTFQVEIDTSSLVNVQSVSIYHADTASNVFSYGLQRSGAPSDRTRPANSRLIQAHPVIVTGSGTQRLRILINAACDGAGASGTISAGWASLSTARATD